MQSRRFSQLISAENTIAIACTFDRLPTKGRSVNFLINARNYLFAKLIIAADFYVFVGIKFN